MGLSRAPKDGIFINHLIYDVYRDVVKKFPHNHEGVGEEANAEVKKFYKLVEDGKQELYPGCKTFSKLLFLIHLCRLKCVHGITNTAFSYILELIQELLLEAKLSKSFKMRLRNW